MMSEFDPALRKERKKLMKTPVNQIRIHDKMSVRELVENFSGMSVQARNMGVAAQIWERMLLDKKRPTIFMGLTGPLIAAGLRNVLSDIVKKNMVDVVVCTGAIAYQDIIYARGGKHYKGHPFGVDDERLRKLSINRIYDVFTDDEVFLATDEYINTQTRKNMKPGNYSSREYLMELAKALKDENSLLKACYDTKTPIFVPALNDSSIGIGLTKYWAENKDSPRVTIDPIKDNYEMVRIILGSSATSAIYIGGGVPKNFINDGIIMTYFETGKSIPGHMYAIQVSTAIPMDGGLSGSTLGEAVAWGKVKGDATKTMVFMEASVGLSLLYGYLCGGKSIKRPRLKFKL